MSLQEHQHQAVRLMRAQQVADTTGIPIASIYAMIAAGTFPRQVVLSVNRVAWVESEVQAWLRDRIEKSRAQSEEPQALKRGCRPARAPSRATNPPKNKRVARTARQQPRVRR